MTRLDFLTTRYPQAVRTGYNYCDRYGCRTSETWYNSSTNEWIVILGERASFLQDRSEWIVITDFAGHNDIPTCFVAWNEMPANAINLRDMS